MGWAAVWSAFTKAFPGRWAVEVYPPASHLVDEVNQYHLWMLEGPPPVELRIDAGRDPPRAPVRE